MLVQEVKPASPLSDKVRSLRISQSQAQGGSSSKVPWILCLLLAGSTGYLGYTLYEAREKEKERAALSQAAAGASTESPGKLAAAPVAEKGGVAHESKGYIRPRQQILVSPKVNGMVKFLRIQKAGLDPEEGRPLEEGMHVEKGDILAQLESTDYEADVARARATLAAAEHRLEMERMNIPNEIERAQSELSEAITNRDYMRTVVERNEKLARTVSISPTEIEKAKSDLDSADHRVNRLTRSFEIIRGPRAERIKVAEADVTQARAEVTKSEWRLGNCIIFAPATGTILKKGVEEGNIVNPAAFQGSYSVCEMADLSDLEVDLSIQERDVARIFQGQRCVVRPEAFADRAYEGVVSRLMPVADRAKGAIPVRVKVTIPPDEVGVYLKPEMGAVVSFYPREETSPSVKSDPGEKG